MIRPIIHDILFLSGKSEPASVSDAAVADDLLDTLRAHLDGCVGMAANMIGVRKNIIAICIGPIQAVMFNAKIIEKEGPYSAVEGCLSYQGTPRQTVRYRKITVAYQDRLFHNRVESFTGETAQIIQHELDHVNGILI